MFIRKRKLLVFKVSITLRICNSMQIMHKNKDKRNSSRGADLVDIIVYISRVSRYLEGEHVGRSGRRVIRI